MEDTKPEVFVVDEEVAPPSINPLDENPRNKYEGGFYVQPNGDVHDANGNKIGVTKTKAQLEVDKPTTKADKVKTETAAPAA
jgi:hypothetical protein